MNGLENLPHEFQAESLPDDMPCDYEQLERINAMLCNYELSTRKLYKLDDERYVTVKEVVATTGVAYDVARRRLRHSTDPQYVFAPPNDRYCKQYQLTDGRHVTAREVASTTGLTVDGARHRLRKSKESKEVFKPRYCATKRLKTVT